MALTYPKIGDTSFLYLGDFPPEPSLSLGGYGEFVEDISRPGVDGHAFKKLGDRSEPFQLVTVRNYADTSAARTAIQGYEALRATFVTLTLPAGDTFANVFVRSVDRFVLRPMGLAVGYIEDGTPEVPVVPTVLLMATWTFQRTQAVESEEEE